MTARGTLNALRNEVLTAMPGAEICYHSSLERRPRGVFEYMREESAAGRVLLFQRTRDGRVFYYAQRISPRAAKFIQRIARHG